MSTGQLGAAYKREDGYHCRGIVVHGEELIEVYGTHSLCDAVKSRANGTTVEHHPINSLPEHHLGAGIVVDATEYYGLQYGWAVVIQ